MATLAKNQDASIKKMEATLERKESVEKERDAAKAGASSRMEAFKKTLVFDQVVEIHYLPKLIKIYGDLALK